MNKKTIDKVNQLLSNIDSIPGYIEDQDEVVITIGQHLKGSARYVNVAFKSVEKVELSECSMSRVVERRVDKNAIDRCINSNSGL